MSEERALTTIDGGQLARYSPMDALATMSDAEFEQRLAGLKKAQDRMARIHKDIMERDTHYGVIPGTGNKPTLLKPGAELLCKLHHLVPTFDQRTIIGDGVTAPHIRVLSTCSLHYETEDGPIVAQGVGASNSWEKKYRWREGQRTCPSCGAAAIIKGKAEYGGGFLCWGKKGGCGAKYKDDDPGITGQQLGQIENPDPYDGENTLEKMSAKRAQTDATLRATATSGLFSQDQEEAVEREDKPPLVRSEQPQAEQSNPKAGTKAGGSPTKTTTSRSATTYGDDAARPTGQPFTGDAVKGQPGARIVHEAAPMPEGHLCAECIRLGEPSTIVEQFKDGRQWTADAIAKQTLKLYDQKLCWPHWDERYHADKQHAEAATLPKGEPVIIYEPIDDQDDSFDSPAHSTADLPRDLSAAPIPEAQEEAEHRQDALERLQKAVAAKGYTWDIFAAQLKQKRDVTVDELGLDGLNALIGEVQAMKPAASRAARQ